MNHADERPQGTVPHWLPNAISLARIALVPLWLLLAFEARRDSLAGMATSRLPLVAVLLVLGASDLVDGILARRFHLTTHLGAVLDAVADKLAQVAMVTFLALAGTPDVGVLPLSLFVVLWGRDLVLLVGWTTIRRRWGVVRGEHRWHGKLSSALLFVLLVACLAGTPLPWVDAAAFAVEVLVLGSTLDYVRFGLAQLRGESNDRPAAPIA